MFVRFFTFVLLLVGVSVLHAKPVNAPVPVIPLSAVALTLDACGGALDMELAQYLVKEKIPATIFVTDKWIRTNASGVAYLKTHSDIFQIENHGKEHVAPVLGSAVGPYGVPAVQTLEGLREEVHGGSQAIRDAFGTHSHWYRGATALYSPEVLEVLKAEGWNVAGYSLAIDDGASLPAKQVAERVQHAHGGDVLLGHINHPKAGTREGLIASLPVLKKNGVKFVWLSANE